MAEGGFDFKKFIDDSKAVLMAPKEYFSSMPTSGGFVGSRPVECVKMM